MTSGESPGAAASRQALRRAAALVFVEDLVEPQLGDDDAHHLLNVQRLRGGETVAVADGAGAWRLCRLERSPAATAAARRGARLEPTGEIALEPPADPPIGVGFALTKGDRPEWTVQKLTELGVDELFPLLTARTVVRPDRAAATRRVERLRRVAREAASQARRPRLPSIRQLSPFSEVVDELAATGRAVAIAEPDGAPLAGGVTHLLVGPEGGFAEEELKQVAIRARLATLVLRAETAAIAAGCLLNAGREGIGSATTGR